MLQDGETWPLNIASDLSKLMNLKKMSCARLKRFTYKVIVEVDESPNRVLECFSKPQPKKKATAENAAEGAIWYPKHQDAALVSAFANSMALS
ncbi:hypothetical protein MLD38_014457 [Melastoma candidum]|uniref:Uncharacterized protein n=1 Tax=Melastoma candidum TaxID=119954 RepID=A0ACB9RDE9_9MYRT|nr:hypothetical protein MLD38_014457 [Melastoma candidum]